MKYICKFYCYIKRTILLFLAVILSASMYGCTANKENEINIYVFAATSLIEPLTEIKDAYMKENPNVNIVITFDSSGNLKRQIVEGAYCDIYISASNKQMDEIDYDKTNDISNDYIKSDTRKTILENSLVLAVSPGNSKNLLSFQDALIKMENDEILICIGNSDVPAGHYSLEIFDYFDVNINDESIKSNISYASNVKEIATQIKEGAVDCGFLYKTDAYTDELEVVDEIKPGMCESVQYPAALTSMCKNESIASSFLDYLSSDYAKDIFIKYGFIVPF